MLSSFHEVQLITIGKGPIMSQTKHTQDIIRLGQQIARQTAELAGLVAGRVITEAVRQAKIAQPIVRLASIDALAEVRKRFRHAQPVLKKAVGDAAVKVRGFFKHACIAFGCMWHQLSRRAQQRIVVITGVMGIAALAVAWPSSVPNVVDASQNDGVAEIQGVTIEPQVADSTGETMSNSLTSGVAQQAFPGEDLAEVQLQNDLDFQLDQARMELEAAAAEYDFAAQQWNAELAACQSSAPTAGYTSNQMGRFAAMGIQMQSQPQRQPNQSLRETAWQAKQRYRLASDNYDRLMQSR